VMMMTMMMMKSAGGKGKDYYSPLSSVDAASSLHNLHAFKAWTGKVSPLPCKVTKSTRDVGS
jgi:hypothetical protein